MKKYIIIFHMLLVLQVAENSKSELAMDYIEYLLLFFCLAIPTIVMMMIPVVLFFSMAGNFIAMRDYKIKIDNGIDAQGTKDNKLYLKTLCEKYLTSYSNFIKYFSGLAAWNIFSLLYMILAFDSFKTGLREYFYFPFNLFQKLNNQEIFTTMYEFKTDGIIMTAIVAFTLFFFLLGKYFGRFIAKTKIKERKLNLATG